MEFVAAISDAILNSPSHQALLLIFAVCLLFMPIAIARDQLCSERSSLYRCNETKRLDLIDSLSKCS